MTGRTVLRATPGRWTPQLVVLLATSALLWALVVRRAAGPPAMAAMAGAMGGTMGMGPVAFTGMWALMMGAMMLPSVAFVASLYSQTVRTRRAVRLAGFVAGYLAVWSASALPAWLLLRLADLAGAGRWRTVLASAVFATVGLWQLTPVKRRCLRHCRSPLAQLLHYGSFTGPLRDVRVAVHHGVYCLGCCWALMAVFAAVGVMNLVAMVGLAGVVAAEKLLPGGERIASAVGVLALVAAAVVWWVPWVAPALS